MEWVSLCWSFTAETKNIKENDQNYEIGHTIHEISALEWGRGGSQAAILHMLDVLKMQWMLDRSCSWSLKTVSDITTYYSLFSQSHWQVCRRLRLCSKEYHKRYLKQLMSRFGVHSLKESHKKGEVFRLWTTGNFKPEASDMSNFEGETALQDSSQLVQVLDTSISAGNYSGNNQSENEAAVVTETSKCTTINDEGSGDLLVRCNTRNSDVEQRNGILADEQLQGRKSVNYNMQETQCLSLVKSPRSRSHPRSSRLAVSATSILREQRILKILEVCPLIC